MMGSTEHVPNGSTPPAVVVFGLGMGALITTVFGFFWLGWGLSAQTTITVAQWLVFYVATLALLAVSIVTLRTGKARADARGAQRDEFRENARKRFTIITILEGAGCGIVVLLTLAFHRMDLLAFGISLVVGVHFLPLAGLFRFPAYYATGIGIILSDLLSWAIFKSDAMTVSVGIATGAVLWITAIYALLRARNFLKITPRTESGGRG
jgi:small-conductance mechanosensitive channel